MNNQPIPTEIGKYTIVRPLGRGGMGQVYLAEDTQLQRKVAIKCLRPELSEARWQENLKREALVLARLNHPNIVQVHDIVEMGDAFAIVTEYVDGRNLHILLRERQPAYTERLQWLMEIAAGLAAAHAQGISHNDLKPENILVGTGNVAKINDFGIASTDTDLGEDILALAGLMQTLLDGTGEQNPLIDHLLKRMLERKPAKRPAAAEVADELRYIWLEATQAETPLPPGLDKQRRSPLRAWAGVALAAAIALGFTGYLGLGGGKAKAHRYIAVLPARLDIDDTSDARKYALLASSVQQGLYEAVSQADGFSLVSPAETGQQAGSPQEIGLALNADELLIPSIKCVLGHCELSTERLAAPDFRLQDQRTGALLPELTLEAFQIARHQWSALYGEAAGVEQSSGERITEEAYRRYLELYQAAYEGGELAETAILDELTGLMNQDIRFTPLTVLYVQVALNLFAETRNDEYLEYAREALTRTDRWAGESVLLHKAWFDLALEAKDYQGAERQIEAITGLAADAAFVLALKGKLQRYSGDPKAASESYRAALQLHPTRDTYRGAALSNYFAGDAEAALELIEHATQEFPDDGDLTSLKGLILLDQGDVSAAIEQFKAAIALRSNAIYHIDLGLAYMLAGQYQKSYEEFTLVIDNDNENPILALNVADSLALLGRQNEAAQLYSKLAESYADDPVSVDVRVAAQSLAQLGEYQRAIELLQAVREQDSETHFTFALVYALAGQNLAALAQVNQALQGGMGFVWFRLSWFDSLCSEPGFVEMMAQAGDAGRCAMVGQTTL